MDHHLVFINLTFDITGSEKYIYIHCDIVTLTLSFMGVHLESDIILRGDKVAFRLCIQKNCQPEQMGGALQNITILSITITIAKYNDNNYNNNLQNITITITRQRWDGWISKWDEVHSTNRGQ